jgi:hypothetical protein
MAPNSEILVLKAVFYIVTLPPLFDTTTCTFPLPTVVFFKTSGSSTLRGGVAASILLKSQDSSSASTSRKETCLSASSCSSDQSHSGRCQCLLRNHTLDAQFTQHITAGPRSSQWMEHRSTAITQLLSKDARVIHGTSMTVRVIQWIAGMLV